MRAPNPRELRVVTDTPLVSVQLAHAADVREARIDNVSRRGMLCSDLNAKVGDSVHFEVKHRGRSIFGVGQVRWRSDTGCGLRIDDFMGHSESQWLQLMSLSLAQLSAEQFVYLTATPSTSPARDLFIPAETSLPDIVKMFVDARADIGTVITPEGHARLQFAELLPYWMECQELDRLIDRERICQMMTALVHDLSTPIGIIRTTNSLLLSGIVTPERFLQEGYAAMVDENCKRILDFADDAMTMRCNNLGEMRLNHGDVDLVALLRDTEHAFALDAQSKGISFNLEIEPREAMVFVDACKIERALHNLVSNALKYSASTARVCLCLHGVEGFWQIDVVDTGVGIAADDLPYVFDEFSRVASHPSHGERRHGFGLSIAKGIVEAHDGEIRVKSSLGRGSTFSILLPTKRKSSAET